MKESQKNSHNYLLKLFAYSVIGMLWLASLTILAQRVAGNKPVTIKTEPDKMGSITGFTTQKSIYEETLKDVYKDVFLVGAAVTPAITSGTDKASQDIVVKHFNSITVENVMKAALINPQPGVYNFGPADDFVAFGERNKMFIVGHTLVWHNQCPPWFFTNAAGKPGLLVEVGNLKGFDTFIPNQDKNGLFLNKPLGEVSSIENIPVFSYEFFVRRARTIDVIWFNEKKMPSSFFEVEHSTNIYNSLIKFSDLRDFYSTFCIVADNARKREYESKLKTNVFNEMRERISYMTYDELSEIHTNTFKLSKSHKNFSFLK